MGFDWKRIFLLDATIDRIISLLLDAEESVDFLCYSFTSDEIANALLIQAENGVHIRGVLDAAQVRAEWGSEYRRLRDHELDIRLDSHPEKLHHKVIILDGNILITGSYNLTYSAETFNDENTLIIHNREIAEIYQQEFNWIFEEAVTQ
jgi:phosphatidylserine/phosphatidylglycerophosphate/cardiolipin synthase-like enzyme